MANLSSKTGFTPNLTQISLANNAATTIQNMSAYDGQLLTGFVYVDATTDKRAFVVVQVIKNGAGTYEVAAADVSGDDEGGSPIVTFAMSGNNLQATLPNFAGFTSAYIRFKLDAPALGAQFPLQVAGDNVTVTNVFPIGSASAPSVGIRLRGNDSGYTVSDLKYYMETTHNTTFTFASGGSGTTASKTLKLVRIGNTILLHIPDARVNPVTGSPTVMASDTALPIFFRPSQTMNFPVYGVNSGSAQANPMYLNISTSGVIALYRDASTVAAFSGEAGTVNNIQVCYSAT